MSEIQEELNNRIAKCIKRETGINLLDSKITSKLSPEEIAIIQEYGFRCGLNAIRKIAKKKFMKWVKNDYEKLEKDAEAVEKRVIRFSSKVGDPVDVYRQITLLTSVIENLAEDIDGEELLSDHSAVIRLLIMSYLSELKNRVFISSLQPLLFTVNLAQSTLSKNMSWCTSMLALTMEEQFVKKKAVELGIEIGENEDYYSILKKVIEYLNDHEIRLSRDVLLADSHRKIRNKVLHENWNPTEDEMDDIIAHVLKITEFFESEALRIGAQNKHKSSKE